MDSRATRGMTVADARDLRSLWVGLPAPRTIVTSPPYFDMHDYGSARQIGYGQSFNDYLADLREVFDACANISCDDATLWIVAGSVRRNSELIQLPSLIAACAQDVGWVLREEITWDKGKSLPWTKHGELRDVTERILLLSKTRTFHFDPSSLLSSTPSSDWWVRYPERYSPEGRLPTNVWSIPIPTQGSWTGSRTHFCPFPPELGNNLLSLTTAPGDVVLDPFAGIGSIPAMAEAMGRVGYGLEISSEFSARYNEALVGAERYVERMKLDVDRRGAFRQVILELRLLKYARVLGMRLSQHGLSVQWVRPRKSNRHPVEAYKVIAADFEIVVDDPAELRSAQELAEVLGHRPPLSKFGIESRQTVVATSAATRSGYWYAGGKYWLGPVTSRLDGNAPDVVAAFRSRPEEVDDS